MVSLSWRMKDLVIRKLWLLMLYRGEFHHLPHKCYLLVFICRSLRADIAFNSFTRLIFRSMQTVLWVFRKVPTTISVLHWDAYYAYLSPFPICLTFLSLLACLLKSNSAAIHELGDLQLAPQSESYADIVNNAEVQDETLTPEVTSAIYKLWNEDEAIRECVSRSREFQLNDSAP